VTQSVVPVNGPCDALAKNSPFPGMLHRISRYAPKAFVAPHTHRIQEQVYHVLDGEGLMEIDGQRRVVRRHDVVFVPPGVEHALYNTGLAALTFLVITAPVSDDAPPSP